MKLDPRIKSLSDVLTCFDIEKAKEAIGQIGYFTDDLYRFADLRYCDYGTLTDVRDGHPGGVFHRRDADFHNWFFLPESSLKPKEKQYRPFTPEEFCTMFCVGQPVKFRKKGDPESQQDLIMQGIWFRLRDGKTVIYARMGSYLYSFDELFDNFEWRGLYQKDFVPFGVEVEE